jgi:signal transduction histidine kinase
MPDKDKKSLIIKLDSALVSFLKNKREPIINEEISFRLNNQSLSKEEITLLTEIKKELDKGKWAIVLPLFTKDKLIGLLCLGPKLSGEVFSNTDLGLLTTLANQIAIAIENASVYEHEKELSRIKSEFISVASHKLRTPLSVIKWALALILEEESRLSLKQKELIDKATQSNDNMIALVNNLLNVSRIEEGKAGYEPELVRFDELVEQSINQLKPEIEKRKIDFSFNKPKETLPQIKADVTMIKIVVENLISNALMYAPQKRVEISLGFKKVFFWKCVITASVFPKASRAEFLRNFFVRSMPCV